MGWRSWPDIVTSITPDILNSKITVKNLCIQTFLLCAIRIISISDDFTMLRHVESPDNSRTGEIGAVPAV